MKPSRPYLVKALYEWLLDNDLTPHLMVDAEQANVQVPQQFVDEGKIVLNVAPGAVRDWYIDDQAIAFNARFSGQPMDVYVPIAAIIAIYARENGQGMGFGAEPGVEYYDLSAEQTVAEEVVEAREAEDKSQASKRPSLKVVK